MVLSTTFEIPVFLCNMVYSVNTTSYRTILKVSSFRIVKQNTPKKWELFLESYLEIACLGFLLHGCTSLLYTQKPKY